MLFRSIREFARAAGNGARGSSQNGLTVPPYSRISWNIVSRSAETRISFWRSPCSQGGLLFSRFHRRCSGRTARQLYPSPSPSPPFGSPQRERPDSISCAPWRLQPMPFPSSSSGPTICLPSKKSCVSCPHGCPARCSGPSSSARPSFWRDSASSSASNASFPPPCWESCSSCLKP